MAADPDPALRAELLAVLKILNPQIRGLHDLLSVSISDILRERIQQQITSREHRRDLIKAVLSYLDAAREGMVSLEEDGYPAMPSVELPSDLYDELRGEESDLDAAVNLFVRPVAAHIIVEIGEPVPKTSLPSLTPQEHE